MAWSELDDHPLNEEMEEKRANEAIDRIIDEADFRYEDNHGEIEKFINNTYPTPEESPDLPAPTLVNLAGREMEKNISKVRELFHNSQVTDGIPDEDYQYTLEYIALRGLRNGTN